MSRLRKPRCLVDVVRDEVEREEEGVRMEEVAGEDARERQLGEARKSRKATSWSEEGCRE